MLSAFYASAHAQRTCKEMLHDIQRAPMLPAPILWGACAQSTGDTMPPSKTVLFIVDTVNMLKVSYSRRCGVSSAKDENDMRDMIRLPRCRGRPTAARYRSAFKMMPRCRQSSRCNRVICFMRAAAWRVLRCSRCNASPSAIMRDASRFHELLAC